jgi:hypothetical protein
VLELAKMARDGGGGARLRRARRFAARTRRGRIDETKKVRLEEGRSVRQRALKTREISPSRLRGRRWDNTIIAAAQLARDENNNKAAQHGSAGARQHGKQHGAARAVVRTRRFPFDARDARFERNGGRWSVWITTIAAKAAIGLTRGGQRSCYDYDISSGAARLGRVRGNNTARARYGGAGTQRNSPLSQLL